VKNAEERRLSAAVARNVAFVAAVFCLVVSLLIITSYLRSRSAPPLDTPALQKLIEEGKGQDLKDEIRDLDLLARQAFFAGQQFRKTGTVLLLLGIVVLLAALRAAVTHSKATPDPLSLPEREPAGTALKGSRWAVGVLGGLLVLTAAGLLFVATDPLAPSSQGERTVPPPPPAAEPPVSAPAVSPPAGAEPAAEEIPQEPAYGPAPGREELLQNWTAFRGLDGDGNAHRDMTALRWNEEEGTGILWKVKVPRQGYSSPIVWEGKILLTGGDEKVREIFCYEAASGKLLWRHEASGIAGSPEKAPKVTADTGYAAPTMATDGLSAVALFATGDLVCVDLEGKRRWAMNLGVPTNPYGHASSPMIREGLVLLQYDDKKKGRFLAVNVATGRIQWDVRRDVAASWATPALVPVGGETLAVLNAAKKVIAYEIATGKERWGTACLKGEVGPSPAFAGGRVFAAQEWAPLTALDAATGRILWQDEDAELPDASSPYATEDYLFLSSAGGLITCLDAKSGEILWEEEFDDGFYASSLRVGEHIWISDFSGTTHFFKPAGTYEAAAPSRVNEKVVTIPAPVGGRIYLRGIEHLYCMGSTGD